MTLRCAILPLCILSVAVVAAKADTAQPTCSTASFPTNLAGKECFGLLHAVNTPMGNPIKTAADCILACCANSTCGTWNWCDGDNCASAGGGCWIGKATHCSLKQVWVGGSGRGLPPPPPPPPPALPGAPLNISLPTAPGGLVPKPLPYKLGPNVDPKGNTFAADSVGFLRNGKRFYPISGEIHLARLPSSQWREELMRMKAGGLNSVAVYIFWIHHEEVEGQWNFTGRRDIKQFFRHVSDLGMMALLRTGPWDHGECRNGGHPDWILEKAKTEKFKLRSNNTGYMDYVTKWYAQVAAQVAPFWFHKGGPIWGVQVDNETSDWKYLLALMQVALSVGYAPVTFTKTGWPAPAAGYPSDYPMMPFFGGYADNFWSNRMGPNVNDAEYHFGGGPSLKAGEVGWDIPAGYPWVDVEIGGGMAAAYNHRVHMDSSDMPAMHLCDVANGVNGLGYYMYHGGNNPHSTGAHCCPTDPDAPENTLQESSFQPAGAQNPMPSFSYDFYAPLGEFGQPRQHFHQMRRFHLMLSDWDVSLYSTSLPDDTATTDADVRWAVRSNGSSGFIFANNYQRLHPLPAKELTRFGLRVSSAGSSGVRNTTMYVPSMPSKPFTFEAATWFVWPFNQVVGNSAATSQVVLAWATAQLLCRQQVGEAAELVIMAATQGVPAELALLTSSGASIIGAPGTQTAVEGQDTVIRRIAPGLGAAVTITTMGGHVLKIVVLPNAMQDKVWKLANHIVIGAAETDLVLEDVAKGSVYLRGSASELSVWTAPALKATVVAPATTRPATVEGEFTKLTVDVGPTSVPTVKWELKTGAGAPREIPKARSGKPQEPNGQDWLAAATYLVVLRGGSRQGADNMDVRLGIDYEGDAARVYFGKRCLTDNWFSGYKMDGRMEVGLDYLEDENSGILDGPLTINVLPLTKAALETNIFLQPVLWPVFPNGTASVCNISTIHVIPTYKAELRVAHDTI